MRLPWPFVLAVAACGSPGARLAPDPFDDLDVAPVATHASYDLRWHGALIGDAVQRDDGLRLERRERIVVRRGAQAVVHEVALAIERDGARPIRVALDDGDRASGVATATDRGWAVEVRGEPPIELPWAPPFEDVLAPAVAAGGDRGPALLAGWGFAIADLTVAPTGDGWLATLAIDGGVVTARLRFGADGLPVEIDSGDGGTATRRPAGVPAPRFEPIEVVDGNALTVDGGAAAVIDFPDARVAIPAVPGQLVWRRPGGGWRGAAPMTPGCSLSSARTSCWRRAAGWGWCCPALFTAAKERPGSGGCSSTRCGCAAAIRLKIGRSRGCSPSTAASSSPW